VTRPTVPMVVPWVREWYKHEPVGGVLHIVLDDLNVEDKHVQWCVEHAREEGDVEGERLAQTLAYMTVTQRRKVARAWYP
jgi:hypothetical protein